MRRISRQVSATPPRPGRHRGPSYPDVGDNCQSDDGLSLGTPEGACSPRNCGERRVWASPQAIALSSHGRHVFNRPDEMPGGNEWPQLSAPGCGFWKQRGDIRHV